MKAKDSFFTKQIIRWGKRNHRKFAWRKKRANFFTVFLAEFLLRRTRADDVNNFLVDFLKKYKSFKDIISTPLRKLRKELKPLGLYNGRSKALKKIAQQLVNRRSICHEDIMALPHCGRYIANAVRCFYYGEKRAIVDKNIERIFGRFFSIPKLNRNNDADYFWKKALKVLPSKEFIEYNYYILDFSAIICKPIDPQCLICPLRSNCYFYHNS